MTEPSGVEAVDIFNRHTQRGQSGTGEVRAAVGDCDLAQGGGSVVCGDLQHEPVFRSDRHAGQFDAFGV